MKKTNSFLSCVTRLLFKLPLWRGGEYNALKSPRECYRANLQESIFEACEKNGERKRVRVRKADDERYLNRTGTSALWTFLIRIFSFRVDCVVLFLPHTNFPNSGMLVVWATRNSAPALVS